MSGIAEYIKMAIENIKSNKARSFLTMLGIIIGISSVIMIMSIGEGVTKSMNSQLKDIAGGQAYLSIGDKASSEGVFITEEDIQVLNEIEGIESASPQVMITGSTENERGHFGVNLNGGTDVALKRSTLDLKSGEYFTEDDVISKSNVALILDTDAKKVFGTDDVIGNTLYLSSSDGITELFTIIGVLQSESTGVFSMGSSELITLETPWTVVDSFSDPEYMGQFRGINVYMDKEMDTEKILDDAVKTLEKKYQVKHSDNYFYVENFQNQLNDINETLNIMTTFVAFVGGISLMVGGIGVMNIMLVSVTERTREIGIRKSLGAKTASIMTQFLAESAILTVIGGFIGITLGIIFAKIACIAISGMMDTTVNPVISIISITVATLFSTIVGIFFGLYPARKAAKMNPIDALRS